MAARASALLKPLLRAAIVKLAAMRFTSYSNGPGSVSSKSLRSNSSVRSGDANAPKLERCASPQSWTSRPATGVSLEIGGHDLRGAPVERERRRHHPPVADGHEVRLASRVLLLEQRDRDPGDRRPEPIHCGRTEQPVVRAAFPRASRSPTSGCRTLVMSSLSRSVWSRSSRARTATRDSMSGPAWTVTPTPRAESCLHSPLDQDGNEVRDTRLRVDGELAPRPRPRSRRHRQLSRIERAVLAPPTRLDVWTRSVHSTSADDLSELRSRELRVPGQSLIRDRALAVITRTG